MRIFGAPGPFDGGGGGGGGVTQITSADGSVTVTNPTGPTVDLSAPDTDDLTWSFSRNGNVSAGAPLRMSGGLDCASAARRGMIVTRATTLISVGWARSDTDAGSLQIELYRGGVIQAAVVVGVPAGILSGTTAISIPALAGDAIGAYVSAISPNTMSNVIVRVRGELP